MTGQKKITDGWFRRFMMQQPQLSLCKGDPTANVRMDCLNKETMDKYFDLLKDMLVENLMTTPTLKFTPHVSTTESAKTLPTLEFTPHASTTVS